MGLAREFLPTWYIVSVSRNRITVRQSTKRDCQMDEYAFESISDAADKISVLIADEVAILRLKIRDLEGIDPRSYFKEWETDADRSNKSRRR